MENLGEDHGLGQLVNSMKGVTSLHPVQASKDEQVLHCRRCRVQSELLGRQTNQLARLARMLGHVEAVNEISPESRSMRPATARANVVLLPRCAPPIRRSRRPIP